MGLCGAFLGLGRETSRQGGLHRAEQQATRVLLGLCLVAEACHLGHSVSLIPNAQNAKIQDVGHMVEGNSRGEVQSKTA